MKILLITNNFPPPKNTGRAVRMDMRVNFLMEQGWKPVVLKLDRESGDYLYGTACGRIKVYRVADPLVRFRKSYIKERIPRDGSKENVSEIKEILSRLFFSDRYVRWIVPLVMKARDVIENEKVDVIYSMSYPGSLHMSALVLKRIEGLPWIAEFRDPLAAHPFFKSTSFSCRRLFYKILEKMIVQNADIVVYYHGAPMEENYFYKTYPLFQDKIKRLPFAGFDFKKFENITPKRFSQFTITYGGTIYTQEIDAMISFLEALCMFKEKHRLSSRDIRLNLLSDLNQQIDSMIKQLRLDSVVHVGKRPYDEYLQVLKGSNLLLLLIPTVEGYQNSVPLKVWDYIGVRKPILALLPRGWKAAKLVESKKLGIVVDPENQEKIASVLEEFYFSKDKSLSIFSPSQEFLNSLDARKVQKMFCGLLDEITSSEGQAFAEQTT